MTPPRTAPPVRLRGSVIAPSKDGTARLYADAVLELQNGRIAALRAPNIDTAVNGSDRDPPPSRRLLFPGFVDLHCHWPQSHVRGRFAGALLPWLRASIWPAEATFRDTAVASQRARAFVDDVLRAGTTAGLFFGPPFLDASLQFLATAPHGMFDGPALMETECPATLQTPAVEVLDAIAALPALQRRRLSIAPRFAPNLTPDGLRACGVEAARLGLLAQSHLSENLDEVAWVRSLYPDAQDYTDAYDRAGLLGEHVVMAHAIHLSDRELARLAETRTMIAHCPTSNEALGSGRMPLERLREAGVQWALATDVGAGPQLSQLDAMGAFLRHHEAAGVSVSAVEALTRATAVPGAWLAKQDGELAGLGTLGEGAPAHVIAYPLPEIEMTPKTEPEIVLRALLDALSPNFEDAAQEVWCWGRRVVGA